MLNHAKHTQTNIQHTTSTPLRKAKNTRTLFTTPHNTNQIITNKILCNHTKCTKITKTKLFANRKNTHTLKE